MNFNPIIYTSADYIIALSIKGIPYPLSLVQEVSFGAKKNAEYQYIIGSTEPEEIIDSNSSYPGRIQMEAGELELLLIANLYSSPTQIRDATLTIISKAGALVKQFFSLCIIGYDGGTKAGDKRSLVTLTYESLGITGT